MTNNQTMKISLLFLSLVLSVSPVASFADDTTDLGKLLDQNAPALVTVQFVLQVKMSGAMGQIMGDSQEFETETVCPVIDPKGLILCSNTQMGGYTGIMRRVMGRMGSPSDLTALPAQIRVLIAGEAKPLSAKLLVRDTDLDLAWLQIEEPGERRFAYIDFARSATPRVGDELFAVRRLDKFFDRAPALLETRVGGITRRPRSLYIPTSSFETSLGVPVLTARGQAVGFLVLQVPEESGAQEGTGGSIEMMTWSARMQDIGIGVILPAEEVIKSTRRAIASLTEESRAAQ